MAKQHMVQERFNTILAWHQSFPHGPHKLQPRDASSTPGFSQLGRRCPPSPTAWRSVTAAAPHTISSPERSPFPLNPPSAAVRPAEPSFGVPARCQHLRGATGSSPGPPPPHCSPAEGDAAPGRGRAAPLMRPGGAALPACPRGTLRGWVGGRREGGRESARPPRRRRCFPFPGASHSHPTRKPARSRAAAAGAQGACAGGREGGGRHSAGSAPAAGAARTPRSRRRRRYPGPAAASAQSPRPLPRRVLPSSCPAMKLSSRGRGCCAGGSRERGPPPRSPFVHQLRFSPLQKARIAFMTLTLFPIRLFFAAFMMLLAWPFAFIASMGSDEQELEKPLSWWRKIVDILLKAIMRMMWLAGGFHWINVKGRRALPAEAAILTVAPHSSYFDAIPVTMTFASIVMKAESKDIPVWGTLIKYIRPVFVSRSDQDSRRKTVEEIKRRAQSDGKWPQIMIFPEGTCTNRSCLITFKPGAFIPGVPVQPVVLRYPNKLDTITWTWQGPGAFEILWLTLCQFHNSVEIEFLPVYIPSEEERKNPVLYANNVRRVMAEALGVPVTDYTFEDCQLALAEGQLRLPSDTCLLEFAKLVRSLGLKPETLEDDLDKYAASAMKMKNEKVDLKQFSAYLEFPVSQTLESMFALFDENENGVIDIREFVIALSVVCKPSKTLETIQLAFQLYQSEGGTVTEEDLAHILKTAMGVSQIDVTHLFRAVDEEEKGKITYDDFYTFAVLHPQFAEEYLYADQMGAESGLKTSSLSAPNGICTDFSPDSAEDRRRPLQKKLI
ncbi:lysophosphatidylcholine acyltransferase 1 [Melospiza georgiana]|uniref:lysophosphatidylcholine acyltransferase 1 n=1 Tax=Melospiza georgiana TaxID=44398 RepID=UPI0025ACECF8|nr:lysophosphatidylcholine acyltransferase 1 [Melospiza georgiana]